MNKNLTGALILAILAGGWYWNSLTPMQKFGVEISGAMIEDNVSRIGKVWVCSDANLRWMAPNMCTKLDAELRVKYPR